MGQPFFWSGLLALSLLGMGARALLRRPLLPHLARSLAPWEALLATGSLLVLVFHCMAMFFASWVDLVPPLQQPAAAVRALGTASEVSYWAPSALLLLSLRRVWWPAPAVLAVALVGVGYTMFVPHALWTHLWWIAAAVVIVVVITAGLVSVRRDVGGSRAPSPSRAH